MCVCVCVCLSVVCYWSILCVCMCVCRELWIPSTSIPTNGWPCKPIQHNTFTHCVHHENCVCVCVCVLQVCLQEAEVAGQ